MSHCYQGDCKSGCFGTHCSCDCEGCMQEWENLLAGTKPDENPPAVCKAEYQVGSLVIKAEPDGGRWRIAIRQGRSTLHFEAEDERKARALAAVLADMIREGVLS